jgi:predicted heme/steroid binding protein
MPTFTLEQVKKHDKEMDIWIVVHGKVYDVTNFLDKHPGGKKPLLKVAGLDASKQFDAFHNKGILEKFGPQLYVGDVVEERQEAAQTFSEDSELYGELNPYGDPAWYTGPSPYYKPSHAKVRHFMRQFVDTEIMPYCHEWDEAKQVPMALFTKCAERGILAAICGAEATRIYSGPIVAGLKPEEMDAFHEFIVCDELSRCGSGGVLWGLVW